MRRKIFDQILDITSACEEDQHFKPYQKPLIYQVPQLKYVPAPLKALVILSDTILRRSLFDL